MTVKIGDVTTIPQWEQATKEQVLAVGAEMFEVYSAWETWMLLKGNVGEDYADAEKMMLVDECADLITATCDLLAGLGVTDMTDAMARCEQRNRDRGRL